MMTSSLQLEPSRVALGPVAAWLIPGRTPQQWLAAASTWNVASSRLVFRLIPTDARDLTPCAALITVTGSEAAPTLPPGGIPYTCLAGRLFLPVLSRLSPAITLEELSELLPRGDSDLVWHPRLGLIQFDRHERYSAAALFSDPPRRQCPWDRAVPGHSVAMRLVSIEPDHAPTADEILQDAGDGIGSRRQALDKLPRHPEEGLAGLLHDVLRRFRPRPAKPDPQSPTNPGTHPASGDHAPLNPSWLQVGSMALAAVGFSMMQLIKRPFIDQQARQREIDRLMNMLEKDPDTGLQYAPPLNSAAGHRGVAPPSNHLGQRRIDFALNQLSGGGPVDAWDIPALQRVQLHQKYRELAAREARLGRHRRAAYIYAQLLGDLTAAAGVLEAGGHYREAATLYRERLGRAFDAARCLEQGGYLEEAAREFQSLGMIERAADIYLKLDRVEEAHQLLRDHVRKLLGETNYLRAAEILETGLKDHDGAIAALESGWQEDRIGAETCLRQIFVLFNTHSRHDQARQRIADLRQSALTNQRAASVTRVLCTAAQNQSDTRTRRAASEAARTIVGRHLPTATAITASALLEPLRGLHPEDSLLSRDCDRFVRQLSSPKRIAPPSAGLVLERTVTFSEERWWTAACSDGEDLFFAGISPAGAVVLRSYAWSPHEPVARREVVWSQVVAASSLQMVLWRSGSFALQIHAVGGRLLTPQPLYETRRDSPLAGSPPWITPDTLTIAGDGHFAWRVRDVGDSLEVAGFGISGTQLANVLVTTPSLSEFAAVSLSVKRLRLAVGPWILRPAFGSAGYAPVQMASTVRTLLDFGTGSESGVIAVLERGAVVVWESHSMESGQTIADDLEAPVAEMLDDRTLVLAGRHSVAVYTLTTSTVRETARMPLAAPALAVTKIRGMGTFAVVRTDGKADLFRLRQ